MANSMNEPLASRGHLIRDGLMMLALWTNSSNLGIELTFDSLIQNSAATELKTDTLNTKNKWILAMGIKKEYFPIS